MRLILAIIGESDGEDLASVIRRLLEIRTRMRFGLLSFGINVRNYSSLAYTIVVLVG